MKIFKAGSLPRYGNISLLLIDKKKSR